MTSAKPEAGGSSDINPVANDDFELPASFERKRSLLLWTSALGVLLAFAEEGHSGTIGGFGIAVPLAIARIGAFTAIIFHMIEFWRECRHAGRMNTKLSRDVEQATVLDRAAQSVLDISQQLRSVRMSIDESGEATARGAIDAEIEKWRIHRAPAEAHESLVEAINKIGANNGLGNLRVELFRNISNEFISLYYMKFDKIIIDKVIEIDNNLEEKIRKFENLNSSIENYIKTNLQLSVETAKFLQLSTKISMPNQRWFNRWTVALPNLTAMISLILLVTSPQLPSSLSSEEESQENVLLEHEGQEAWRILSNPPSVSGPSTPSPSA